MQNHSNHDDASHYEVSLTAGQAFIAFVLLLFSLAAAFAFGVIVGNGQFTDENAATTAAAVPQHTSTVQQAKITELEPAESPRDRAPVKYPTPVIIEEPPVPATEPAAPAESAPPAAVPHFAQILSTTDAKAAETLAAKLIEGGFPSSYVERSTTPRGTLHRVRVRFSSEEEARQAAHSLQPFAAGEIWVAPVR